MPVQLNSLTHLGVLLALTGQYDSQGMPEDAKCGGGAGGGGVDGGGGGGGEAGCHHVSHRHGRVRPLWISVRFVTKTFEYK
jgi:hypothetical protein